MAEKSTYLLTWNPVKYSWRKFHVHWDLVKLGEHTRIRWSCGHTKKIRVGDRVFMMRLGYHTLNQGIFASGTVTREPEEGPHWSQQKPYSTTLYIEFEPDVILDPNADQLFDPTTVLSTYNWHPQSTGVTIPPNIAMRLEQAWGAETGSRSKLS